MLPRLATAAQSNAPCNPSARPFSVNPRIHKSQSYIAWGSRIAFFAREAVGRREAASIRKGICRIVRIRQSLSGWFPRSRRVRVTLLAILATAALAAYVIGQRASVVDEIELNVVADSGAATIGLAPQLNGVSPACGCMDPRFGKLPWSGLAIPSTYFDLGIDTGPAAGFEPHEWQLTVLQPRQDIIDWLAAPEQTLLMNVTVLRHGWFTRLFEGRATFLDMVMSQPVEVEQDQRFPYAALLPGGNGSTTVRSESPPRPNEGGFLQIESNAPERPHWAISNGEYWRSPEMTLRGPMLDVIGRTRFRIDRAGDTELFAGEHQILGIRPSDRVEVSLRTPYSLRLIPSPAPRAWVREMGTIWDHQLRDPQDRDVTAYGPTLTGRFLVTEPLPSFAVRLTDLQAPERRIWSRFAARSANEDVIGSMLRGAPKDGDEITMEAFGLPPVPKRPEVGVFGRVTRFTSNSLRGELAIGPEAISISRGQLVSVNSPGGLSAGRYRFTSLISAGDPTDRATISGRGEVRVNDNPQTKAVWLSWPANAIGAAVVALILGGLVSWSLRGRRHRELG